jgi:hypothetical protein
MKLLIERYNVNGIVYWTAIENILTKEENKEFNEFMIGQTCVKEGAFVCDVERFIKDLSVID